MKLKTFFVLETGWNNKYYTTFKMKIQSLKQLLVLSPSLIAYKKCLANIRKVDAKKP